jgi:hypothetical protein
MLLVASAVHEGTWNIAFRRTFGMEEAAAWVELRDFPLPLYFLG